MNDVPLVKSPDVNAINTSIIAIKKQLKQINEAVGLIDIPNAPDLSPYVKKSDIVDVVAIDNMHAVTSSAVAVYANKQIKYKEVKIDTLIIYYLGYIDVRSYFPSGMNNFLFATMWDYGNVSSSDALGITANGSYIYGTGNAQINNIVIRYFYTD